MTAAGFDPEWLALREPADAAARAADLLDPLRVVLARRLGAVLARTARDLAPETPGDSGKNCPQVTIRDLGSGTGSMRRWLSGRLGVAERWVLQDRDPELLALATRDLAAGTDGLEVRVAEIGALTGADLTGTSLVTASALLDVLTAGEVDVLVDACVEAGCPALLTLTVTGSVELDPPGPFDRRFEAAFNRHQRCRGLGPDAVAHVTAAFEERGATVLTRPSPWRLEPGPLTEQWLRGWVEAACEQEPDLAEAAPDYLRRAGELKAVVGHADVLAIPGERT
ncbi:hypothetical protein [Saccharopolyspora flava]|uniref:Methyltransferase domain-containing protein n=1 Tax=Saccharopolyspora flava TaxID=95161 RepID=A0A1I6S9Z5_9PSEU|nr:hypothetical protein [Saccharopolyspora flava]SFS73568.1 hypothetical protein SAMN05660874_03012 [Saccharopolyspora flava]